MKNDDDEVVCKTKRVGESDVKASEERKKRGEIDNEVTTGSGKWATKSAAPSGRR